MHVDFIINIMYTGSDVFVAWSRWWSIVRCIYLIYAVWLIWPVGVGSLFQQFILSDVTNIRIAYDDTSVIQDNPTVQYRVIHCNSTLWIISSVSNVKMFYISLQPIIYDNTHKNKSNCKQCNLFAVGNLYRIKLFSRTFFSNFNRQIPYC